MAGETTSDSMLNPRREKHCAIRARTPGLLATYTLRVWIAGGLLFELSLGLVVVVMIISPDE
jgi:hypothetical protein